jgi:hypothetical protein
MELRLIKHLSIAGAQVASLDGLPFLSNLQSFVADHSCLVTLRNFRAVSNVTKISLKGTPISKQRNYKLSLLLICGPQLKTMDDQIVPRPLRDRSQEFPNFAADFVNKGWLAETPAPDPGRWDELSERYSLAIDHTDEEEEPQGPEPDGELGDFEAIVTRFKWRQQQLHASADEIFGTNPPDKDDELKEKLNREFQNFGLKSEEDERRLLKILEAICIQARAEFANELEEGGPV